jgi:hypothetical protein
MSSKMAALFSIMKNLRIVLTIVILSIILFSLPSWALRTSSFIYPDPGLTLHGPQTAFDNTGKMHGEIVIEPGDPIPTGGNLLIRRSFQGTSRYWNDIGNNWTVASHQNPVTVLPTGDPNLFTWEYTGISPSDFTDGYTYFIRFIPQPILPSNWVTHTFTWDGLGPTGTCQVNPSYLVPGTNYLDPQYYNQLVHFDLEAHDANVDVYDMIFAVEANGNMYHSGWIPYATSGSLTLPNEPDGTYTVYAYFRDSFGNLGPLATWLLEVDTTPPTFVSFLLNGYQVYDGKKYLDKPNSTPISLDFVVTGGPHKMITAALNMMTGLYDYIGDPLPYNPHFEFTPPIEDGYYSILTIVADEATNQTIGFEQVRIDTTAPELSAMSLEIGQPKIYTNQNPSLSFHVNDKWCWIDKVYVKQDGNYIHQDMTVNSYDWDINLGSLNIPTDSTSVVEIFVADKLGNHEYSKSKIYYDITRPTIYNVNEPTGTILVPIYNLNGRAQDNLSGVRKVEVSVNGGPYVLANGTIDWNIDLSNFQNETNDIAVKATDYAGNNSIIYNYTINADIAPPEEFDATYPNDTLNPEVIKWEQTQDLLSGLDHFEIVLLKGSIVIATYTASATDTEYALPGPLPDGKIEYFIKAVDTANNIRSTQIHTFYWDKTPPDPFAILTPSASQVILSHPNNVGWEEATDNSEAFLPPALFPKTIAKYEVYFDNTFVKETTDANEVSIAPTTPLSEGDHEVNVKAFDAAGNSTTSSKIVYINESAPQVTLTNRGETIAENSAVLRNTDLIITIDDKTGIEENTIKVYLDNIEQSISQIQPVTTVLGKTTEYAVTLPLGDLSYELHSLRVEAADTLGVQGTSDIDFGVSISDIDASIAKAYPNPAALQGGDIVKVVYSLEKAQDIKFLIYTITGARVYERLCRAGETENMLGLGVVGKGGAQGTNIVVLDDLGILGNGVYIYLGVDSGGNPVIQGEFGVHD